MRNFLAITTIAAGIALSGAAWAADSETDNMMYTTGSGDNMMVMGGTSGAGAPIAKSKDQCKEGGYYVSGENMIASCAEGGMSYELSMPANGQMVGGQPLPDGAMMMKEHKM